MRLEPTTTQNVNEHSSKYRHPGKHRARTHPEKSTRHDKNTQATPEATAPAYRYRQQINTKYKYSQTKPNPQHNKPGAQAARRAAVTKNASADTNPPTPPLRAQPNPIDQSIPPKAPRPQFGSPSLKPQSLNIFYTFKEFLRSLVKT